MWGAAPFCFRPPGDLWCPSGHRSCPRSGATCASPPGRCHLLSPPVNGSTGGGGGKIKRPSPLAAEAARIHSFLRPERPPFCTQGAPLENLLCLSPVFQRGPAPTVPRDASAVPPFPREGPPAASTSVGRRSRLPLMSSERPPCWMRDAPSVFCSPLGRELRDVDQNVRGAAPSLPRLLFSSREGRRCVYLERMPDGSGALLKCGRHLDAQATPPK
ncbi:hypothetical protein NDU88_005784 [Pleurodeles waltl]|uniref:Uncharacterized protein n=1 Tax=Pleurodeles waltl TaxID=8319 RepID=A0AAV7QG16_PLEWA|nr:hypothetical protein NDU88_005784 [Pleurodeles waltl]